MRESEAIKMIAEGKVLITEADLADQNNTPKLKKVHKELVKAISALEKISYGRLQTNPLGIKWIKQLKAVTTEMGRLKGM